LSFAANEKDGFEKFSNESKTLSKNVTKYVNC